jgi:succinate-semialdehyde dehydrogenase/glutarate-semialdehyde dehydrogenase
VSGFVQQCIAGAWREGRGLERFAVHDPATGEVAASYAGASEDDVDAAAASAAQGFADWSSTPAWTRGLVLLRVGELLRAGRDRFARLISAEQGKPLAESLAEVARAADFFTWAGGEAPRLADRIVPSRDAAELVAASQPMGVVCLLTPWNYPLILIAKKVSAALAAGCACVLKPSEETPGVAVALVQACQDAGVPPNALNLLLGEPAMISRRLIAHPVVRKVSFTGSVPVGRLLAEQAACALKPITLELGGHAPVIVCDDAPVEAVAAALCARKFHNAGQACIAPSRIFVAAPVFDRFLSAFTAAAQSVRLGPGLEPATGMGPLANPRRLAAMESFVDDALRRGGEITAGGRRRTGPGWFFEPTVVARPAPDARLMTEEPFGPIAAVVPFNRLDDAVAQANALPYGLAAYAFAEDPAVQQRLARGLEAGLVGVNDLPGHLPEYPLGGWKESGLGVEGGAEAIESYRIRKLIARAPTART